MSPNFEIYEFPNPCRARNCKFDHIYFYNSTFCNSAKIVAQKKMNDLHNYRYMFFISWPTQLHFREHRMHAVHTMRPIATHAARSMVYLCVGHKGVPCKCKIAKLTEVPFGELTRVGPMNHVLDRGQDPHEKGQFWGCPAHWKALGVSAAVYATVVNNGMQRKESVTTCDAAVLQNSLTT